MRADYLCGHAESDTLTFERLEADAKEAFGKDKADVYLSAVKDLINKGQHNLEQVSKNVFRANSANLSYWCTTKLWVYGQLDGVKIWLKDHLFIIILTVLLCTVTIVKLKNCTEQRRRNKMIKALFE